MRSTVSWMAMAAGLAAGAVATADAQAPPPPPPPAPPARQTVDLQVPNAPAPVRVDGVARLVHELHLTSFAGVAVSLAGLEVLGDSAVVLGAYTRAALAGRVWRPGLADDAGDPLRVAPGMRLVVYLELPLAPGRSPRRIRHRVALDVETAGGARERHVVEGGDVAVSAAPIPELGPPLRGGPWAAVYAPEMTRGHRRVLYAVEGRARIPGRLAIDWFRVDAAGRTATDSSGRLASFLGHGAEVLAVADGIVAAARDGVAEPATVREVRPVAMGDAAGNFIALDIGGGRYALYEHLGPGLRVRRGDRVRKGQVIGALGLTGQGTMPHLHFHVADAPSPLAAEGQPFHLTGVTLLGRYPSIEAFGRGERWTPAADGPRRMPPHLPAANVVVELAVP